MTSDFLIGKVLIRNQTVLAPMAGITDMPFRLLSREGGAALVWSEMLSAKALLHRNIKTEKMLDIHPGEHPVAIQLFGSDPRLTADAAKKVQDAGADIIDINLGCPVPKIRRSGSGIALMKEHAWVYVIRAVVDAVTVPVTIKIRTGLIPEENTAPQVCKIAESEGIKAIAIHARPASSLHKGPVFWEQTAEAVAAVHIPVIANGGIHNGSSAYDALKQTGCAAIMIGRGCLGDFAVFRRVSTFLESGKEVAPPSFPEKVAVLLEHLKLNAEYYGEELGIKRMRKILPFYCTGFPHAARLRHAMVRITTLSGFQEYVETDCSATMH